MVQTIESFVEKLKTEGVQAGQAAGEKLQAEARAKAEQILADAQVQAERIVADAQAQARKLAEQQQSELQLATRDAVLAFRNTFNEALGQLLLHKVSAPLTDGQFLTQLIRDVVVQYATDDAHGGRLVEVRVSKEFADAVANWAVREITHPEDSTRRLHLDLKSGLESAGFEYTAGESTVEVTAESVAEVLKAHAGPRLREILDQAMKGMGK